MLKRTLAFLLSASLAAGGCASGGGTRVQPSPTFGPNDRAMLADYVQKLPIGSRIRVERTSGSTLSGTLMKATPEALAVQLNTRLPEPSVEVPLDQVSRVTLDNPSGSTGKMIAIGAAVGAAATFGVLLILAAIFSD